MSVIIIYYYTYINIGLLISNLKISFLIIKNSSQDGVFILRVIHVSS